MANILESLFALLGRPGRGRSEDPSERVTALLATLKSLERPCLRLARGGDGRSRFGGAAEMAGDWPRRDGRPLSLLAQLDLAEMRAANGPEWLPERGRLLFFYDLEESPWGFDPRDAGSGVVRYEAGPTAVAAMPADLPEDRRFKARPITFTVDGSVPDETRLDFDWKSLSPREQGDLEEATEAMLPEEPAHQVGGYPWPVQGDTMEWECQMVTHGLSTGDSKAYRSKRGLELKAGESEWLLLLQLDTDESVGMTWGDGGRLYFWIREEDARAGDFSKVWTILQCY